MRGWWPILLLGFCAFNLISIQECRAKVVAAKQRDSIGTSDLFNARNEQQAATTCGYGSCPKVDPSKSLNVHLVPHSHDDVGWLKSVDQYYYGTRKRNSPVGVQYILDSVVPELVMDKTKRFIYVEMSFFTKWWEEQDEQMRSIVRRLVNEGRLEFINGGWCMNDEASVSYQSTIEQMTLGLRFLNETFGACGRQVKVGWQIDPFGHSSEQASLFAQFGFDGMFFTRISWLDKHKRTEHKSLDLVWHGDRALSGQSGSIFTSISRDGYDSPNGFCFDVHCLDDNLVDNKKSYEYNIDSKGKQFIKYLRKYAESRLYKHIMIPLGGDFQYSAAGQNFKNSDKLIKYVRSLAPDVNIFYSTPSCYQYAVHQQLVDELAGQNGGAGKVLPEKYDDFMPYDSSPTVWWSGYFASRPSVKLVERETANLLQVARFISLANLLRVGQQQQQLQQQVALNKQRGLGWLDEVREHDERCLQPLWEILGDLQHHDAVTGTEKQHVANDYVRRATDAWALCSKFIGDMRRMKLNDYLRRSTTRYEQLRESGRKFKLDPIFLDNTMLCPLLNISQCDAMEAEVDVRRYTAANSADAQPRTKRAARDMPTELETKAVLLNLYNPLAKPVSQHDVRLPCNGRCDLDKVRVIHLASNESMKLIRLPLPSGIATLPFRDALTKYEILFYANIPALGYTSFVVEDTNSEEIVDEENDQLDSIIVNDETIAGQAIRSRRTKRNLLREKGEDEGQREQEFSFLALGSSDGTATEQQGTNGKRVKRELSQQSSSDRVIVKFDMASGMIAGLKRASDGSFLNITQKFGYYFPSSVGEPPGAYIFRPNSSEPHLLDKPVVYKMFKRKSGALIEIHQKWADWLWQTIRVDAKKNYIEFDYVVGPIPVELSGNLGREVVTRYVTNMNNNGVFMTDSNGRQLLPRHKLRSEMPEQLGGSFYPVVSTLLLKNNFNSTGNVRAGKPNGAEAVAVLVDRPQAGTSLNEGQMELLIHRRQMRDDHFGVEEALNEPGEDGRGLVSRGRHRLYLKFQDLQPQTAPLKKQPTKPMIRLQQSLRANLSYEDKFSADRSKYYSYKSPNAADAPTYIVSDTVLDDLSHESRRHALKPVVTFDRLRVSASEFMDMIGAEGNPKVKTDLTLLNMTMPANVHLLTLQPWTSGPNEVLIRLENLDNPMTLHPYPDPASYQSLVQAYKASGSYYEVNSTNEESCDDKLRPRVELDIEYLLKRVRIVDLQELNLGANQLLSEDKRLDWTGEAQEALNCDANSKSTLIKLGPRQIRTFIAHFEYL